MLTNQLPLLFTPDIPQRAKRLFMITHKKWICSRYKHRC